MSYLKCGRNGNVDKCHTYRRERNRNVDKWHTYNVNETETSASVKLTMWMKLKRRQMAYLKCGRNGNVDKCHTYNVDERKR